jgi:hypothetical protein
MPGRPRPGTRPRDLLSGPRRISPAKPSAAAGASPAAACRRQRGYALLLALVVIFLVFIALAMVFAALALRLRQAQLETQTVHLVALTDAGMAEALAGLAQDPGFPGAPRHDLGRGGTIASRVEPVDAQLFRVTARASYAGRLRAAQAIVQLAPAGELRVVSWQRVAAEDAGGTSSLQPH